VGPTFCFSFQPHSHSHISFVVDSTYYFIIFQTTLSHSFIIPINISTFSFSLHSPTPKKCVGTFPFHPTTILSLFIYSSLTKRQKKDISPQTTLLQPCLSRKEKKNKVVFAPSTNNIFWAPSTYRKGQIHTPHP